MKNGGRNMTEIIKINESTYRIEDGHVRFMQVFSVILNEVI